MKTTLLFLLTCFFFSLSGWSQGEWWKENNEKETKKTDTTRGTIEVVKDPRIEKLIAFKGTAIPPAFEPQMDGYRVQLFFDQEKEEINKARARFLEEIDDIPTYIKYKAPNYNLTAGNFRTKLEAERLRAKLSNEFPESIVVKTRIYLPKIED